MIEIPLRNRNGSVVAKALIDDEDASLAQYNWYRQKRGYVTRTEPGSRNRKLLLHRVIMNPPFGVEVDHINHDGLDNRRSNLRLASHKENTRNKLCPGNKFYKGVRLDNLRGKNPRYRAQIKHNGRLVNLGMYSTPEAAAHAYDDAATSLFGEFASLNFP